VSARGAALLQIVERVHPVLDGAHRIAHLQIDGGPGDAAEELQVGGEKGFHRRAHEGAGVGHRLDEALEAHG
jgi:hypothetical protein